MTVLPAASQPLRTPKPQSYLLQLLASRHFVSVWGSGAVVAWRFVGHFAELPAVPDELNQRMAGNGRLSLPSVP